MRFERIYKQDAKLWESVTGKAKERLLDKPGVCVGPFYIEIDFDDNYVIMKYIDEDGQRQVDIERFEKFHKLKIKL